MNLKIILSTSLINFLFCFGNGHAKLAPDFIHPCDNTSKECIMKSAQAALPEFTKGIPNLNIPALDPLKFEYITNVVSGLTFKFYNGTFNGFRKCVIENAELSLEKKKFTLTLRCTLTVVSTYEAKGQFLLFVIDGEGNSKVKLVNMKIQVDVDIYYIKDNGEYYFGLKNEKVVVDYGDNVHFDLENLFKGNKQLSNAVLTVLNQNWRIFIDELGKTSVNYAVARIIEAIKAFFRGVPCHELLNVPIPV